MENIASLLLPALLCVIALRLICVPVKWGLRLCSHGFSGLACLWLLNTVSGFTGLVLPINAATVLISGFFGIPGTALVVLLQML